MLHKLQEVPNTAEKTPVRIFIAIKVLACLNNPSQIGCFKAGIADFYNDNTLIKVRGNITLEI